MTIIECLKSSENGSTLNSGNRWLYWESHTAKWVVRERTPKRSRTGIVTLIETDDESQAVAALIA